MAAPAPWTLGNSPGRRGGWGKYRAGPGGEERAGGPATGTYKTPRAPSDPAPADPVSIAVALADKLDTLVGFWVIDEKPTGSKDPYALRRAALGVIRIVLDNEIRLPLLPAFELAGNGLLETGTRMALVDRGLMPAD